MLYDHKPMKCSTNSNEHFHSGDGDNVRIGNALGVMVLELGERWKEGLLGKDKEGVIDLLLELVKVDKELVFFRGGFQSVLEGFIGVLVWGLGL